MSSITKNILTTCSNIKLLFESNISTINSIKQHSDEIFQIVSGKPTPNRIDLISKRTTTILRKEKTLLNTNKDLSSNIDKLEKILLELLKNVANSQQLNDQDTYKEITESIQRKNNELTKLRNINENLNNEIIKLKNMMKATSSFGKFANEDLIDVYQSDKFFIENIKKESKEQTRKKSIANEKKENKTKNAESKGKNAKSEKDNKDKDKDSKENKQLQEQIQQHQKTIEQQKEEIQKIKEELSLANSEKEKLAEELKNKESSDNSKHAENEKELKKLQDDFIKLTVENEERKTSISNKDSLIKDLMKDCDDKKKLIEEGKENIKKQTEEINKLKEEITEKENDLNKVKNEFEEFTKKANVEKEEYEKKIKEQQELASKSVPTLTQKFKELTQEIEKLKKENKEYEIKNKELEEGKENYTKNLEEAQKQAKEAQMKLKSKEALIKQIQKRMGANKGEKKEGAAAGGASSEEVKKLKDEISSKDEIVAQLNKEKEEMEEKLKNYLVSNPNELVEKMNKKEEEINSQKAKIEELTKIINESKSEGGDNKINMEEELKSKKTKINKLEMKITVAKVNLNKLLGEIKINDDNKLFIEQLMKNLGFDEEEIKKIIQKTKEGE